MSFVDPADEAWLAEQSAKPDSELNYDGVCFVQHADLLYGPFANKAEAYAAHPVATDITMSLLFGDPAVYHVRCKGWFSRERTDA